MENRDQNINNAKKNAVTMRQAAEKEAASILAQARAARIEKIKKAEGESARFVAMSRARKELDFFQEVRLRMESVDAVLRGDEPPSMNAFERRR